MKDEIGTGIADEKILQEILTIVRTTDSSEYERVLEEKTEYPYIYHLSGLRSNIVQWLPIDETMDVLEIGAECGAITEMLAKKAKTVTYTTDLAIQDEIIRARLPKAAQNQVIGYCESFMKIKEKLGKYDMILLNGTLGYAKELLETSDANAYEELLSCLKQHLTPQGHLVVADANRIGLKYFAGCQEEHLGTFFTGIEGYPQEENYRTFTKKELERLFENSGFLHAKFYYPYPDFRFMTTLYSDAYLPKPGSLIDNMRNIDRDRVQIFEEQPVFDTLIEEGLFPEFSNSFLVMAW